MHVQARKTLTARKAELETERAHVGKLQQKFSAIHATLVAAAAPAPAAAATAEAAATPPSLQQQPQPQRRA